MIAMQMARLVQLLSEVTGAPVESLGEDSTPANTRGWDSLTNLSFLGAIEEEFGVSISTADALGLRSLGDVATLLRARQK